MRGSVFESSASIATRHLKVDVTCLDFFVLNPAMEALFQLVAVSHYLGLHSMAIHYLCLG